MRLAQMLIVCESYLYSLQICIKIWYNTIIKAAIKCDIRCKIKPCNCRLLLRTTYYAPVAELAYAAASNPVFLRVRLPAHHKAPSTSWSKSPASQAGVGSSSLPGVIQALIYELVKFVNSEKWVQICRGRLTVGQRIANPSSGQFPACEFESRSLRHMLMWSSGRWQRSRKPPVRNCSKVRILP